MKDVNTTEGMNSVNSLLGFKEAHLHVKDSMQGLEPEISFYRNATWPYDFEFKNLMQRPDVSFQKNPTFEEIPFEENNEEVSFYMNPAFEGIPFEENNDGTNGVIFVSTKPCKKITFAQKNKVTNDVIFVSTKSCDFEPLNHTNSMQGKEDLIQKKEVKYAENSKLKHVDVEDPEIYRPVDLTYDVIDFSFLFLEGQSIMPYLVEIQGKEKVLDERREHNRRDEFSEFIIGVQRSPSTRQRFNARARARDIIL